MAFDIAKVLTTIAPTLAGMLGGPFAATAVSALENCFGLAPGAGVDGITQVVQSGQMTPDVVAKIREADQRHAEALAQQNIDLQKINLAHQEQIDSIEAGDRDSARKREVSVKDSTPSTLAYIIIGGFFALASGQIVAIIGFAEQVAKIPPQGWLLIGNISGYLAAEAKAAASYYFGSSAGSQEKTQLLADKSIS